MKGILIHTIFVVFGTALLLYSVIFYEPPAFFAYAFGILTGLCWAGIVGLIWIRQKLTDNGINEIERNNKHEYKQRAD